MANTKQIEVWMEIGDEGREVLVMGEFIPACYGGRDAYGQATEPDEPATAHVLSVEDKKGNEVSLSSKEEEIAIEKLLEEADCLFQPYEE